MLNTILLVFALILVFCWAMKAGTEKMCQYPGTQRFYTGGSSPVSPRYLDPYNPLNIAKIGPGPGVPENCCGWRNNFNSGDGYIVPNEDHFSGGDLECDAENFACCGSGGNYCLPTGSNGCMPSNQLGGGQLPCNSIGNYWLDYPFLIGSKHVWRILDAKGWPMTYDEALKAIPMGGVVCWNGDKVGSITGIYKHVNMPMSAFISLDQQVKLNLSKQMVNIQPAERFAMSDVMDQMKLNNLGM